MKTTLLEIGHYNKRREYMREFVNEENDIKLRNLQHKNPILRTLYLLENVPVQPHYIFLKETEVQSTEHKGAK